MALPTESPAPSRSAVSALSLAELRLSRLKLQKRTPVERIQLLHTVTDKVLVTSSFGTQAVVLLDHYHRAGIKVPVYFINTRYHFKETLEYKDKLVRRYGLDIIELAPDEYLNQMTTVHQMWKKDPDSCCGINKVYPLERVKSAHHVWVSGLMAWQTPFRKNLTFVEQKEDMFKFYPLLDMTEQECYDYMRKYHLPEHPLKNAGYGSIGCTHCTAKGQHREGRWQGKAKDECGLHVPLR